MAKRLPKLLLGEDRKEHDLHGTPAFPCEVYETDLKDYSMGKIPEHWHNEMEIGIVTKGKIRLFYAAQETEIAEGEGFFLNTNVLHSMEKVGRYPGRYVSIVFHENLVKGPKQINERYVSPVLCDSTRPCIFIKDAQMIALLQKAIQCFEKKNAAYELEFRNDLNEFWLWLFQNHRFDGTKNEENMENQRVNSMLRFIAAHYHENISMDEVAKSASISKRECYRCFKKKLGHTPNTYLNQYRLNRAAEKLMMSNKSIAQIGFECGFTTPGYFATKFKTMFHMTPSEYREQAENNAEPRSGTKRKEE
jgi:AraC-like DNA-binding protein/mannose-6-phosphate isomerase-like protein (cupin superfamily)